MRNVKCYSQLSQESFFSFGRQPNTHEGEKLMKEHQQS